MLVHSAIFLKNRLLFASCLSLTTYNSYASSIGLICHLRRVSGIKLLKYEPLPWRLPKARSPLVSQVFIGVKYVSGIVFLVKQVADYVVLEEMESTVYMVAGDDGRSWW